MLQPDLSTNEQVALFNSAWNMYHKYFDCDSLTFISFDSENIKQLKDILDKGSENITKLQTSQALFQAYDHVYNLLDQEWVPKFFDSEDVSF